MVLNNMPIFIKAPLEQRPGKRVISRKIKPDIVLFNYGFLALLLYYAIKQLIEFNLTGGGYQNRLVFSISQFGINKRNIISLCNYNVQE